MYDIKTSNENYWLKLHAKLVISCVPNSNCRVYISTCLELA